MVATALLAPSPLGKLWRGYERLLRRRPIMTQALTSALTWGAGDLLAQRIAARRSMFNIDVRRALLTASFGGAVIGPVGHHWYQVLDAICSRFGTPGTLPFLLTKLLADNLIFNSMYIAAFLAYGCAVIDCCPGDVKQRMTCEFVPTLIAEASMWPPIMAVIFSRVPVAHQLLAINMVTIFDVGFLSWLRDNEDFVRKFTAAMKQQTSAFNLAEVMDGNSTESSDNGNDCPDHSSVMGLFKWPNTAL